MGKKFWSTLFKPKYIASLLILLTLSTGVNAESCITGNVISKYYTTDRQRGTTSTQLEVNQIPSNIREYITGNNYITGTKLDIEFSMEIYIHQGNWKGLEYEPLVRVGSTYITNNCTILAFENWYSDNLAGTKIRYWGVCSYTTTADVNYIDISINTGITETTMIGTTITYETPCIKKDDGNAEIINNDNKNTNKIIQEIQESNAELITIITNQTNEILEKLQTTTTNPGINIQIETWEEILEKEAEITNKQAIENIKTYINNETQYLETHELTMNAFRIMWLMISHFFWLDVLGIKYEIIAMIFGFGIIGLILKR